MDNKQEVSIFSNTPKEIKTQSDFTVDKLPTTTDDDPGKDCESADSDDSANDDDDDDESFDDPRDGCDEDGGSDDDDNDHDNKGDDDRSESEEETLLEFIFGRERIPIEIKIDIILSIARMMTTHTEPTLLLAMENIVQDNPKSNWIFSKSALQKLEHKNGEISELWQSPGRIKEKTSTIKTDVYSFGILIYVVLTQKHPFPGFNLEDIILDVAYGESRPNLKQIPEIFHHLLKKCWDENRNNRPTFDEIIQVIPICSVLNNIPKSLCQDAGIFWWLSFGLEAKVSFQKFIFYLSNYLNCGKLTTRCINSLAAILFSNNEEITKEEEIQNSYLEKVVTQNAFVRLIHQFGRLDKASSYYGKPWFERIAELVEHPCFFGEISREDAMHLLSDKPPCHWILRFNRGTTQNAPIHCSPYTITRNDYCKTVINVRVYPRKKVYGYYFVLGGIDFRGTGNIFDCINQFCEKHPRRIKNVTEVSKLNSGIKIPGKPLFVFQNLVKNPKFTNIIPSSWQFGNNSGLLYSHHDYLLQQQQKEKVGDKKSLQDRMEQLKFYYKFLSNVPCSDDESI